MRILFHLLADLGTVCPTYIAPMHMFSLLLVSVRYSEDSDMPNLLGGVLKVCFVFLKKNYCSFPTTHWPFIHDSLFIDEREKSYFLCSSYNESLFLEHALLYCSNLINMIERFFETTCLNVLFNYPGAVTMNRDSGRPAVRDFELGQVPIHGR